MRNTIFAAAILMSIVSGEAFSQTVSTTWNKVASEGQSFSLSGTQTVRYGAGSNWVQKSLSGTSSCSNATFGTDPAYGVAKGCEAAVQTTTSSTTTTWSTVAAEGKSFTVSGAKMVRYGAGSTWIEKALSGTQTCSNTTFGKDPIVGVAKTCQVSTTTTATTTPPPTTTTPPPTTTTTTWSTVAQEGSSFSVSGTKTVRYGAGTTWIEKALTGTQTCSNTTFGKDPIVGVAKTCQVSSSSTATTTPPAVTSYTAKLNWTAPSTREDGSALALSDLKGYEIYYTSDDLTQQGVTVAVSGGSSSTYSVSALKAGTYHFAISAIDSKGLKSQLSPLVSTTFK